MPNAIEKVAIKVKLEREIWLTKDTWENSFGEQLPTDMDDLEMLQDEALIQNTEFKGAEVISTFSTGGYAEEKPKTEKKP